MQHITTQLLYMYMPRKKLVYNKNNLHVYLNVTLTLCNAFLKNTRMRVQYKRTCRMA